MVVEEAFTKYLGANAIMLIKICKLVVPQWLHHEPLQEPLHDYCFEKVSRLLALVLQTM